MENGSAKRAPVKRSAAEWREIFRDWEASGEGVGAYCAARGISPKTFSKWRGRFRGESAEHAPAFVAVQAPEPRSGGWEVELDLGGGVAFRLRRP